MSEYARPKKSSGTSTKKSFYKAGTTQNSAKKTTSTGPIKNRPQQSSGQQKKTIKKFDPSFFIKKVEEQVASPVYTSKHQFSDFVIAEQIKKNIIARGYKTPTPIQDEVIPLILEGKDVIASANTGTGKTAAFLIPLVSNVLTNKTSRVLIIAPTRELAEQIHTELAVFKGQTGIISALCIGGLNLFNQIDHLEKNPQFVIGTPGRLIDLERHHALNFSSFTTITLDEVDTMLDMGFINDIQYMLRKLPNNRHSLFFSATVPQALKSIIDGFLQKPISINVKTRQSAENVNQQIIKVDQKNKIEILHDLLIKPECKKAILFLRTKHGADKLSKNLLARGFQTSTIHGDKSQAQRKRSLDAFRNNRVNILLATDVVARGIDIDDVSHVINYDLPQTHEDYIHRIGRTGRADKIGQAITFIE